MKERWPEIKALFHEVYDLDSAARRDALARPEVDPWVRAQVERLLAADGQSLGILDHPTFTAFGAAGPTPFVGRMIGPYRVVREIGRGGMGTVYEAIRHDTEFEQRVAIKRLRLGLDLPELVSQFRRERQILANLQHPNIAALYDGGVTEDGIPYIVLEYVDGLPIDRYCDEHRLGLRDRLDLFRQVLDAVRYAHQQLVIHRDIKPGNILVTSEGYVKLLDFGVARLIRADGNEMTQPGAAGITPAYASPEQLRGERASTATDVYSLALVLYRLLTGKNPIGSELESPTEVLSALTANALPAPSTDPTPEAAVTMGLSTVDRLRRLLHGELDAVILKALRPEPERRYQSVEALADDLLRYLKGLPVVARPDTAWYRFSRFVRRRRGVVGAVILAVAALIAGTAVALWQARRANLQATRATKVAMFLQEVIGTPAPLSPLHAPQLGPGAPIAELIDSAAARIDQVAAGDPEIGTVLHQFFGQVYQSEERPDAAAREFARMAQLADSTYGPGLAHAMALAALAQTAMARGVLPAADSLLVEVEHSLATLDSRRPDRYGVLLDQFGYLPPYPWPRVLAGMKVQVDVARSTIRANRGDMAGAVTDLKRIVAWANANGVSPDIRAQVISLLGQYVLATVADRKEGADLLRAAQRLADSLPDPAVVTRADVLEALVSTGTATGAEADSLGREVFRIYEKATGPTSLATARQLWLRGSTARMRGDTATQRASLTRAMQIVETNPATSTEFREMVAMEYARTHWLAGHLDSAVIIADRVYSARAGAGPGFPVAEAGHLLGSLLRIRGERTPARRGTDYARAERVLLQADSIARSLLPPTHYWPTTTAGSLIRLYRSWGKEPAAERFLALLSDSARATFKVTGGPARR